VTINSKQITFSENGTSLSLSPLNIRENPITNENQTIKLMPPPELIPSTHPTVNIVLVIGEITAFKRQKIHAATYHILFLNIFCLLEI